MSKNHKIAQSAVIIGTGFSGICMAIKLKQCGIHDFVILEKAQSVGGTWRENTYPGAECDIPSALYSYSFEPYLDWEHKWSVQTQILAYIKHVVKKHNLHSHIRFNQELTSATWQEQEAYWLIKTKDGNTYKSRTFIPAIGQLHHPSIPDFKGKDEFKGIVFHSAKWNHDISLKGKTVGVIGNGASAIQFIPEIAKTAEKLKIFQRSANWILPKQDRVYKDWEKKLVRRLPFLLKIYRTRLWLMGGALYLLMKNGNHWLRNLYQKKTIAYINKYIKETDLVQHLIPNYPMGAKRVLFSDTYYQALARQNVKLVPHRINEITATSVLTDDKTTHDVDVLIYATGFKSNPFLMNIEIKGKDNSSIHETWQDAPKNYLGIAINKFPNLFMMYGPNTNLGHNSIIIMSEAQANYISQCVLSLKNNNWKSLEIKNEAMQAYHQAIQDRLNNMIWSKVENSWYKSANGNIANNYPGRTMEYIRSTQKVNFKDYHISE